jgi:hypothetical protein
MKEFTTDSSHKLAQFLLKMPNRSIRIPKVLEYDESLDMLPLSVTITTIYKDQEDAAEKVGGRKCLIVAGKGN